MERGSMRQGLLATIPLIMKNKASMMLALSVVIRIFSRVVRCSC
jgi:hypothetical protein